MDRLAGVRMNQKGIIDWMPSGLAFFLMIVFIILGVWALIKILSSIW